MSEYQEKSADKPDEHEFEVIEADHARQGCAIRASICSLT